jgi:ABC-type phosphate transport system substrate-binding protein
MLNFKRLTHTALIWAITCMVPPAWADQIVVIVHKDNTNVIDRALVQQLYTGAVRGWPDGSPAFVLDQPDGSAGREQFSAQVLKRSPANVRAVWAQNIFTGRGLPPKVAADEEMKRLVASNRNGIGYIRQSLVDASVRVVPN